MKLLTALLVALPAVAFAQIDSGPAVPITGAANPALSPDGSRIAFRYRGDVWIVPVAGGTAVRITDHVELDDYPIWSPDGKWVAFSSDRFGAPDVFAIPADGGETRQITYFGGSDMATDWHGDNILITSRRDTPFTGIFSVNAKTLAVDKVYESYHGVANARFSPDGKKIVCQVSGYDWIRSRYNGSGASQLFLIDPQTKQATRLISNGRQHLWPFFNEAGDHVYAVTYGDVTPSSRNLNEEPKKFSDNANRTPNIWKFDMRGRGTRVTGSVGAPIVAPDGMADGKMVYEHMGNIYVFENGSER
jgi:Tol biopolymer transport system component